MKVLINNNSITIGLAISQDSMKIGVSFRSSFLIEDCGKNNVLLEDFSTFTSHLCDRSQKISLCCWQTEA